MRGLRDGPAARKLQASAEGWEGFGLCAQRLDFLPSGNMQVLYGGEGKEMARPGCCSKLGWPTAALLALVLSLALWGLVMCAAWLLD